MSTNNISPKWFWIENVLHNMILETVKNEIDIVQLNRDGTRKRDRDREDHSKTFLACLLLVGYGIE